jgi:ABC-2 type transport system ATP-binding protein
MMSAPLLEVCDLHRTFGPHVAIANLSLTIQPGEVLGLLGANGAGKSTAMGSILGMIKPTRGTIRVLGMDPYHDRIRVLRRLNSSSAYSDLPANLLVWQNLYVFAKIYRVKNAKQKIDELLEMFEISHLKKRVTGHLSAGESTRLHLCKAMINDPELLLLDEPTASLDPEIADKVRKIIRRIQKERNLGILYTSHNMRDVEEVCDRVVFMHRGKVVTEGTPADIVSRFQQTSMEDVFIRIVRDGVIEDAQPATTEPSAS